METRNDADALEHDESRASALTIVALGENSRQKRSPPGTSHLPHRRRSASVAPV